MYIFECSQEKTNLSSGKNDLQMFFFLFPAAMLVPSEKGTNMKSPYLCGTLCQITRVRNTAQF